MSSRAALETLIQIINVQHGRTFVAGERYPAGEQGAFAILERVGDLSQPFVLKWSPGGDPAELLRAAMLTARLRTEGFPSPRYYLVGSAPEIAVVYAIQEALPGEPLGDRLDDRVLDQLLKLNALQRDQADAPAHDWLHVVVNPVLHGLAADHTADHTMETVSTNDVVHFDFQGANILVDGDTVSGVVDWEGWCVGDASFDLATLYFYTASRRNPNQAQADRLWNLLVARLGRHLLGTYLAHLMLRQLDWSIRFHDRAAVERWFNHCHEVLRRLAIATGDDTR